jgi:hypothetical protein
MKWSNQDLAFILYNNRSVEGVVRHFISSNINPFKLVNLEKKLDWSKFFYENNQRFVEIESNKLDLDVDDITVKPEEIQ